MKKTLSILLAVLLLVSMLAGCAGEKTAPTDTDTNGAPSSTGDTKPSGDSGGDVGGVIKFGVFEPMTGGNAAAGQLDYEGMLAANSLVPTVLGKKVEFVVADNKTDDVEAVTAASLIASEGCVVSLGGSGSNFCIAAAPIFEEAQIPAIGTTCTNPLVTEGNEYYLRICYTDDFQGVVLAQYAKKVLGAKTAAIITDITDTYCIGLKEVFEEAFGPENIVANLYFNKGDQDFSAQLNEIIKADPDVVFAPSQYTEAALIAIQAKKMGYNPPFLGPDSWQTDAFIDIGKEAVEGAILTTFYDLEGTPTDESREFVEVFRNLHGKDPISSYSALGYDAYMIACKAIEAAGTTDGPAVLEALYNIEHKGVTGNLKFDDNGDALKDSAYVVSVKDGAFKFLDIVELE